MKKGGLKYGSALAEIVVGAAIMTIGILAINSSYSTYIQYALANQKNVEAVRLSSEGLEVMAFLRDKSWTNISSLNPNSTYYLIFSNSTWATTTTAQYVDGIFLRQINVSNVNRDGNDDISSSGTNDPNSRKITVTVSFWQGHATTTKTMSEYLLNYR
jgi:hypothetical protein